MQTPIQQITVGLGERSYPIEIGPGLLQRSPLFPNLPQQILIITNTLVAPLYLAQVKQSLAAHQVVVHEIGDGEAEKSLPNYQAIMDTLISHSFARDCAIIALGGGVVGDLAGFVAATYQRGVTFYQIPTTLLAQVDSSVGGKTAINHQLGKNLIGAFHQPHGVLIDTDCLQTLSARDYTCGLAEVVKYGIIADADFFTWLEQQAGALCTRDTSAITQAIKVSCSIKAAIVAADETEQHQRALLNLGHTFGHAIEAADYQHWRHGEAVAAGMVIAATLMEQTGQLASTDLHRIRQLLQQLGLPVEAPQLTLQQWQDYMQRDKKVKAGVIRFILPTAIGQAQITGLSDWQVIATAINACSSSQPFSKLMLGSADA